MDSAIKQNLAVDAHHEIFRWSRINRLWMVASLSLFGGVTLVSVVLYFAGNPPELWQFLVFVGFALFSGVALWITLERLEIDATGIRWHRPGLATRSLAWQDVRGLRERPFWQLLELQGDAGQAPIKIHYLVEEFGRLRELIRLRAPGLAAGLLGDLPEITFPLVFRRSWVLYVVVAAFSAVLLVPGLMHFAEEPLFASIFLLLGLLGPIGLAYGWYSMTVEYDRLILRALFRHREIPLSDIAAAVVTDHGIRRCGTITHVQMNLVLLMKDGQEIMLGSFANQTLRAREVIEAARSQLSQ